MVESCLCRGLNEIRTLIGYLQSDLARYGGGNRTKVAGGGEKKIIIKEKKIERKK